MRITSRTIAPLVACGISIGAAVVGGACVLPTSSNPPKLQSGIYVLTSAANGHVLPATFADSNRSLRVFADTFNLNTSTQFFDEHASVAITPRGGVEQPVSPIVIGHQAYTTPTVSTLNFVITLYGTQTTGTVLSPTSFQLLLRDNTVWHYERR